MTILAIKTDQPQAELYIHEGQKLVAKLKWEAHLKLAETLNSQIEKILKKANISYQDLKAIAVFKGPGSFTGLRIGISVANAIAYSQDIPIVARGGQDWLARAIKDLQAGQDQKIALPEYGAAAHTTGPLNSGGQ